MVNQRQRNTNTDAINKAAGMLNSVQQDFCLFQLKSFKIVACGSLLGGPVLGKKLVGAANESHAAVSPEKFAQAHIELGVGCVLQCQQL